MSVVYSNFILLYNIRTFHVSLTYSSREWYLYFWDTPLRKQLVDLNWEGDVCVCVKFCTTCIIYVKIGIWFLHLNFSQLFVHSSFFWSSWISDVAVFILKVQEVFSSVTLLSTRWSHIYPWWTDKSSLPTDSVFRWLPLPYDVKGTLS